MPVKGDFSLLRGYVCVQAHTGGRHCNRWQWLYPRSWPGGEECFPACFAPVLQSSPRQRNPGLLLDVSWYFQVIVSFFLEGGWLGSFLSNPSYFWSDGSFFSPAVGPLVKHHLFLLATSSSLWITLPSWLSWHCPVGMQVNFAYRECEGKDGSTG